LKDGVEISRQNVRIYFTTPSGLAITLLDVPKEVVEQGYDQLWILAISSKRFGGLPNEQLEKYILGHVRLIEDKIP